MLGHGALRPLGWLFTAPCRMQGADAHKALRPFAHCHLRHGCCAGRCDGLAGSGLGGFGLGGFAFGGSGIGGGRNGGGNGGRNGGGIACGSLAADDVAVSATIWPCAS